MPSRRCIRRERPSRRSVRCCAWRGGRSRPHSADELERARDQRRGQPTGSALDTCAVQELGAARLRIDDWQLKKGGWNAIENGLLRAYRQGRTAFALAQREPSLEDLHAWRKRVKDLWYHERLLAPICGPAIRGHAKDAH